MVQTVLGAVSAESLGCTLMHEHLLMVERNLWHAFDDWLDREAFLRSAIPQLRAVRESGVRTIIDATPINLGRDARLMAACARASGMQVIASTGLYYFEEPWLVWPDADYLAGLFLREIREGMEGTGIRPGVIKCATDRSGVTPGNREMLRAAAIAQTESGLPVITHTCADQKNGLDQQRALLSDGVPPERLVIGHCGDTEDVDYLEELMRSGTLIGMDRFGAMPHLISTQGRIDTLVRLLERGWSRQMVLSHDSHLYSNLWQPWQEDRYRPQGERSLRMIPERIVPALRARGVPQEMIDDMLCHNIRRLFGGE